MDLEEAHFELFFINCFIQFLQNFVFASDLFYNLVDPGRLCALRWLHFVYFYNKRDSFSLWN
jgi:hypothetical protein